jgi:glycosyltransferase involved in cell wall biosynthesis
MRVLYLCPDHGLPVFGRKGCSAHVRETCRALARRGHEVLCVAALLTQEEGDEPESESERGFEVVQLPCYRQKWLGADLRLILYNYRVVRACHRLFVDFSPDLIYERYSLYGAAGMNVAQRAGVPHILEVNTRLAREQSDRLHLPSLAGMAERGIWRAAPALAAVSSPVKDALIAEGISGDRVRVMPMAADANRFIPRAQFPANTEFPELAPPGWLTIIYAGALTRWHGVDRLFDLAKWARDSGSKVRVVAAGGAPTQVAKMRGRAEDKGLINWLNFLGSVPYTEVPKLLAASDIGFLPETSEFSSPTKMFEYMAAGLPVLAPRQQAIEEAIQPGENGLLFEPGDASSLVDRLRALSDDPALRRKLGERARRDAVVRHSWDRNAQDIEEFRQEILQRGWL